MPRYYYGENAGRPIQAGGKRYAFEILAIAGGTQQGVLAVPDEEVAAFLAVAGRWVEEIDAAAYADALEKKKRAIRSQPTPDSPPPPRPGPPLKGRGAVVVEGGSVAKAAVEGLPEKLDEAITLGRAEPPMTETEGRKVPESRRQNQREKRGT